MRSEPEISASESAESAAAPHCSASAPFAAAAAPSGGWSSSAISCGWSCSGSATVVGGSGCSGGGTAAASVLRTFARFDFLSPKTCFWYEFVSPPVECFASSSSVAFGSGGIGAPAIAVARIFQSAPCECASAGRCSSERTTVRWSDWISMYRRCCVESECERRVFVARATPSYAQRSTARPHSANCCSASGSRTPVDSATRSLAAPAAASSSSPSSPSSAEASLSARDSEPTRERERERSADSERGSTHCVVHVLWST